MPPPSALLLGPPLWRVRHPLRFRLQLKASGLEVEASSPVWPLYKASPLRLTAAVISLLSLLPRHLSLYSKASTRGFAVRSCAFSLGYELLFNLHLPYCLFAISKGNTKGYCVTTVTPQTNSLGWLLHLKQIAWGGDTRSDY